METPDPGGMLERDPGIDPCGRLSCIPMRWDLTFDVPAHLAEMETFSLSFSHSHK